MRPKDLLSERPLLPPADPPHPITVEVGHGLLPLVAEPARGLFQRLDALRKGLLQDRGIIVPAVEFKDQPAFPPSCYQIRVRGIAEVTGDLNLGRFFAMGLPEQLARLPGDDGHDPVFGLGGKWVPMSALREAQANRCAILDPLTILFTQLGEVVKRTAYELLGTEEVSWMLQHLLTSSRLRQAVARAPGGVRGYKGLLKALLLEQVPLVPFDKVTKSYLAALRRKGMPLLEGFRVQLGRHLLTPYLGKDGGLRALLLAPESEAALLERYVRKGTTGPELTLSPAEEEALITFFRQEERLAAERGHPGILLVIAELRPVLAKTLRQGFAQLTVVKPEEIPSSIRTSASHVLTLPHGLSGQEGAFIPLSIRTLWKRIHS